VVQAVKELAPDQVAWLGQPPLRIDLLRTIEGVPTETVIRNTARACWDDVPIRVISLDDLIANKRAAGRRQDVADLSELERVRARRDEKR
jgi:hypothetical protein